MAGYSDPQSTHNPTTGVAIPAAWGDIVRDDIEWLAGGTSNPKPSCRVYAALSLTAPNNTNTALEFTSERWDTGGMHSTAVNPSRITVPSNSAGKYLIGANIDFAANGTGTRWVGIMLNGTTLIAKHEVPVSSGSYNTGISVCTLYPLSVSDYVQVIVYQNSGGSLSIAAGSNYAPEFWAMWMAV